MPVLIGVPTHKRPDLLRKCLDSVERQEGDLPDVQVFVADNDPVGKEGAAVVAELAPTYRFPLSSEVVAERGISAVRNIILAEARRRKSDLIAMIDDDETANPNWLHELLRVHQHFGVDIVGGPTLFDLHGDHAFEGAFWIDERPTGPTKIIHGTGNVLISSAALERMNWPLFDLRFGLTGGGDCEWFARTKRLGARFGWASDAVVSEVVPPERRELAWFLKRQFRVGAMQIRIAKLHGDALEAGVLLALSAGILLVSPFQAIRLGHVRSRNKLLREWARAVGRFGGILGVHHQEYAARHDPGV